MQTARLRRAAARGLLAAAFTVLAGCGGGPRAYPVHGQLLYEDGQPVAELEGFEVTFSSAELGRSARGTIAGDGTFRLTSDQPDDGAPPGHYKVTVSQPHREPSRPETRNPVVELAYEDVDTTPLEATVEAKTNTPAFTLRKLTRKKR